MSYNFAQFRKGQYDNYLTPLQYQLISIDTSSIISSGTIFKDKAIVLNENNVLSTNFFDEIANSYYLKFSVNKLETAQNIVVKLVNTNKTNNNTQIIDMVEVEPGAENDFSVFEFIITPNNIYNQIQFILERTAEDYLLDNHDGTYGRKISIQINNLSSIKNIIEYLSPSIENKKVLKQIGVQGPSGLLMNINGEAIRIGRSGIYEINNGVKITSLGFITNTEDRNDYFILDYQY